MTTQPTRKFRPIDPAADYRGTCEGLPSLYGFIHQNVCWVLMSLALLHTGLPRRRGFTAKEIAIQAGWTSGNGKVVVGNAFIYLTKGGTHLTGIMEGHTIAGKSERQYRFPAMVWVTEIEEQ